MSGAQAGARPSTAEIQAGRRGWRRWARMGRYWSTVAIAHLPPNRSRSIFVLGHPRTGTNWFCRVASAYFELPIYVAGDRSLPAFGPVVLHLHRFAVVPSRTVYMMRDARDVVVSYYHKALNSLPRSSVAWAGMQRHCPAPLEHDRVRENIAGFVEFLFETNRTATIPYREHVREARKRGLYTVRYEDMLATPETAIAGAVRFLSGKPADPERVAAVVRATSFEARTGRRRGEEDLSAPSVRKGVAGDWRNHFTRRAGEILDRYTGDALVEAGYAESRDWYASLPED